jgi:hypothetical protein
VHFHTEPPQVDSATELRCLLPEEVYASTRREVVLHLSLDGGLTFELMAGVMKWQLLRAPILTGLEARSELGEKCTLSQLVGRAPVLTLILTGTHIASATERDPICAFDAGGGRVLYTEIIILDDMTATCLTPPIPATREQGLQLIRKKLKVSLKL